MPGKVNPVIPESVLQVAAQVIGNDAAITIAGTGGLGGNLELNVMMPLIAYNLLQSIEILARVAAAFERDCVDGIDRQRGAHARAGRALARDGDRAGAEDRLRRAAALAKEAMASGRTVREVALEKKVLPREELDAILDPWRMTEGGIVGGGE